MFLAQKVEIKNEGKYELDFLLMGGQPIREPIAAQGAMVMNSQSDVNRAYQEYQMGTFGIPWEHVIDDDEWQEHVSKHAHLMSRDRRL